MDIKPGDEVFVCLKWNDTLASRWDSTVVEKTSRGSIYVSYPPLLNKRISKETMASSGYIVFVPTESDRIKRSAASFRRELISTLIKANWDNLKTEMLVDLVVRLESDERTLKENQ